jgi:hypothetical protein
MLTASQSVTVPFSSEHRACWEAMERDLDDLAGDPAIVDRARKSLTAALTSGARHHWAAAVCAVDDLLAQHRLGRPSARARLCRFVAENADLLVRD